MQTMAELTGETINGMTIKIKPSARGYSLEWWSLGPEYIASAWRGNVIAGVGFGATEEAAIQACRNDVVALDAATGAAS